jgi:hypothetical protein
MTGRETCGQCGEPMITRSGDLEATCGGCGQRPGSCPCLPAGTGDDLPPGRDQAEARPARPAQSAELLALADAAGYRFGTDPGDEPFGVRKGDHIARMLRGGKASIRAELARSYAETYGRAPAKDALAEALLALEGRAYAGGEHELELRAARRDGTAWLDLGTTSGELARVTAAGWDITRDAPLLFRRTRLTGARPEPNIGREHRAGRAHRGRVPAGGRRRGAGRTAGGPPRGRPVGAGRGGRARVGGQPETGREAGRWVTGFGSIPWRSWTPRSGSGSFTRGRVTGG